MASKIYMPALSPTMTEGVLTKWLVKVGDQVKSGDILAEIETDKATMEVEAVDEGKVTKILIEEGTSSVPVNTIIAVLDGSDDDEDKIQIKLNKNTDKQTIKLPITQSLETQNTPEEKKNNLRKINDIKIKASPYVKSVSNQENIDLSKIKGSGPKGRIIKRDIENNNTPQYYMQKSENPSTMRKIIAERTTLTKQTVPHFYLTIESNVDKLLEMRKKINEKPEIKISINDVLVKSLALAQQMNPASNVSWIKGRIIKYHSVDISIAVALEEGLITPIIKNADSKGLIEISNEIKYLVEKAKNGKLTPDEYSGGTISISNLGMFGISEFSAIINPPQSSILAVGSIKKMPFFVEDEIRGVNILKSTLSADHRVLDGAVAGKLLKDFHDIIEDPYRIWLEANDMEII